MTKNRYPELNIPLLKTHTHNWGERFPCICSISLCRAGGEVDTEDIETESFIQRKNEPDLFTGIEDENDEDNQFKYDKLEYCLIATVPELPYKKPNSDETLWTDEDVETDNIISYYNWAANDCSQISGHIPKYYLKKEQGNPAEWMWFSALVDENIKEYNTGTEKWFRPETRLVLYSRPGYFEKASKSLIDEKLPIEEQVDQLLIAIDNDLITFYRCLVRHMKKNGGILNSSLEDAKQLFIDLDCDFEYLKINHLHGVSYGTDQYTRDIQGGIAKNMIYTMRLDIASKSKIAGDSQKLYKRIKELRRTSI